MMTILAGFGLLLASFASAETAEEKSLREAKVARIVAQNYPHAALKRGEEGDVSFEVELEPDGKLRSCAITRSSGFPLLDNATCEMMVRNAQFIGGHEKNGRRARSSHSGVVAWKLPPGYVKAAAPPPSAQPQLAEKLICRRAPKNGSLYITTKTCLTGAEWKQAAEHARSEGRRMQERRLLATNQ